MKIESEEQATSTGANWHNQQDKNNGHEEMHLWQGFLICGMALFIASVGGQWHIESIGIMVMAIGAILWVNAKTRESRGHNHTAIRVVYSHVVEPQSQQNHKLVSSAPGNHDQH